MCGISRSLNGLLDPRKTRVFDCHLLELPRITSSAGSITPVEPGKNFPFPVKRVYYLYDIPADTSRGGHAHRELHQFIVAVLGAFEVILDDGRTKRLVLLNRPYIGLHIVPGIWRELINFSGGSVCLVLASEPYDEADYLRTYADFMTFKRDQGNHAF